MKKQYRHGDILLVETTEAKGKVDTNKDALVLARGETTGHAHRVIGKAQIMVAERERYLSVTGAAYLTHEEHGRIDLPVGIFRVIQQREYAPEGIRNVAD